MTTKNLNKKIAVLFGCGGDRDKTKRKEMGDIAYKYCDKVYITTDNPRNENPEDICKMIGNEYILDRKEAILKAKKELNSEYVLLILGKGHEKYQEINNIKYSFDDKEIYLNYN
jgi:UDP-N-acetylmuramoyl-L-alanyl-D-glutamate--2,6-diaminopimelate ligase